MRRIFAGLFLVAMTTLMLELTLIRVFDVIWYSNMAYLIITLAMFSFGIAGVYVSLRPPKSPDRMGGYLALLALLFGVLSLLLLPALNYLEADIELLYTKPAEGAVYFLLVYLLLTLPFLFSGMIFALVFNAQSSKIQSLYFFDLVGAGIGCVILLPLLPRIGPGGLLFIACAFALLASALFWGRKRWSVAITIIALMVAAVPFARDEGYYDFKEHVSKRGLKELRLGERVEKTYWDPVSKIDVVRFPYRKEINYDGGSQTSYILPFDGDYEKLRRAMPRVIPGVIPGAHGTEFTGSGVVVSHYLKRDRGQEVLVIGSAGGQETKAALLYGAGHVDAVELVGYVVDLGKHVYAEYNGNIYNDPRVDYRADEGRAYLRASGKKYDIIQMFSNHTSSSIAAGTGAMATTYLQTAEAYVEYFTHLKPDGILHINHHVYPRMITTAAVAWKKLGRGDFRRHVIVAEGIKTQDNLATVLIKMTPWTAEEVKVVRSWLVDFQEIVEEPTNPQDSFLSDVFYSGEFPDKLADRLAYRATPATDNRPYFNFLRKSTAQLEPDPHGFLTYSTAALLNSQLRRGFSPTDIVHLVITAAASLFFGVLFIFVPLFFSQAGRTRWRNKGNTLLYFGCLGGGFIIFELVFIQLFMKLIGHPLHTYSAVVFVLLLAAGIGSLSTEKLKIDTGRRWYLPFAGIVSTAVLLLMFFQPVSNLFLESPAVVRILVSALMLFPMGFFLGMPFPLGILAIKDEPHGAIPWAWALNGLFTVVGGLLSVIFSILLGFRESLAIAISIYVVALWALSRIRAPRLPREPGRPVEYGSSVS